MTDQICVYGLWHLGCVTAACLAEAGFNVVGLDRDQARVQQLEAAIPPIAEPGLAELIAEQQRLRRLRFTSDPVVALEAAGLLVISFDTPVNED